MDREESGMSPSFRLRFGPAQFEMLVEREPRWGVPPAFGKRPGTTALSETTRGQQTLGGVRCQSVSAFYHALSLSLVAPSLIPISPPAQTPASEHLMGSPSRLIASRRLPREHLQGSSLPLHMLLLWLTKSLLITLQSFSLHPFSFCAPKDLVPT